MRAHVAILLLLCGFARVPAAIANERDELRLEEIVRSAESEGLTYALPETERIGDAVQTMMHDHRSAAEIWSTLVSKWHLTDDTARLVVEAVARRALMMTGHASDPDERDVILDLWKTALSTNANDAIAFELISFSRDWTYDDSSSIEFALRRAPHPRDVAIAALSLRYYDAECLRVVLDRATRGGTDDPVLLVAVAIATENRDFYIAAYERRSRLTAPTTKQLTALAENAIAALTRNGRSREAIEVFESLPEDAQRESLAFSASHAEGVSLNRGLTELTMTRTPVALDLAAAYALERENEKALAILPNVNPVACDRERNAGCQLDGALASLIETTVSRSRVDPFGIVAAFIAASVANSERSKDQVALRLFEPFALANGYGNVAEYLFDRARIHRDAPDDGTELPPALASIASRYSFVGGGEPVLETTATEVFKEDGIEKVPLRKDADCNRVETMIEDGIVFPEDFEPIRAERRADRIVAISLSRLVDPPGELSDGGYWIVSSSDRGASWTTLYTGLREGEPYVFNPDSQLPLFDEAGVMLDVNRGWDGERLYVHCSWDDLERDSDGDGLTDVLEARLDTDPQKKDTDGDGVDDLDDPLPQVAYSTATDAGTEVLQSVLEKEVSLKLFADHQTRRPPRIVDRKANVTYFIGDRSLFAGFRPASRVVILSPSEFHAWRTRMGDFSAVTVSAIAIDPPGANAAVAIDETYKSSMYRLEKSSSGKWQMSMARRSSE